MARSVSVPLVRAGVIAALPGLVAERGGKPDRVFAVPGVPLELAAQPDRIISARDYHLLLEAAARELGDEDLGLSLGADTEIAAMGAFHRLVAGAQTLSQAIVTAAAALPFFAPYARTWLSFQGQLVHWHSDRLGARDGGVGWRLDGDYSLMVCRSVVRLAVGPDWQPHQVRLARATPQQVRRFEHSFGAPTRAVDSADALVFRRELLDWPLRFSVPLPESNRTALMRRLIATAPADTFAGSIGALARSHLAAGQAEIAAVARSAGVSVRTLQRRLAEEGTSFSSLVVAARRDAAQDLLSDPALTLIDVAMALGYADQANFSRAFKEWTGSTPGAYRRMAAQARVRS